MAIFVYPAQQVAVDTTGLATEAKQDTIISELQDVNTELDAQSVTLTSIDTKVATETTLASVDSNTSNIDGKITTVDTGNVTVTSSVLPTGAATEGTLGTVAGDTTSIDSKITAVDTGNVTVVSSVLPTGASTSANQTTANASLSSIESDLTSLNARLAGNLVPETFDFLELTYVAAGNGAGEIETVTYKTGGGAGSTVATLTLAYDASDRLSSVTRS